MSLPSCVLWACVSTRVSRPAWRSARKIKTLMFFASMVLKKRWESNHSSSMPPKINGAFAEVCRPLCATTPKTLTLSVHTARTALHHCGTCSTTSNHMYSSEKSVPVRAAVVQVHGPLMARAASGVGSGSGSGCSRRWWAVSDSLHFCSINDTSIGAAMGATCRFAEMRAKLGSSHTSHVISPTSMWLRTFRQGHHMFACHRFRTQQDSADAVPDLSASASVMMRFKLGLSQPSLSLRLSLAATLPKRASPVWWAS